MPKAKDVVISDGEGGGDGLGVEGGGDEEGGGGDEEGGKTSLLPTW